MSFAECDKCGLDDCECEESGIVELLSEVGNDNITYQTIHDSIAGITRVEGANKVSFYTDCMTPDDLMREPEKIGLVIWVDREVFSNAHEKITGNQP